MLIPKGINTKHDENVANLDVVKTSLSDVSHELAKAKHELELVKDAPIVSDVLECDECPIFKSDLASLQSKFATVVCELEELRSRPALLGACKLCPTLRSELEEKNALIKSFGKTKVVESSPPIDFRTRFSWGYVHGVGAKQSPKFHRFSWSFD